jgi:hypothetical protein
MDSCAGRSNAKALRIEYVEFAKNGCKKKDPGLGVQARGVEGRAGICLLKLLVVPAAHDQRCAKRQVNRQNDCGVSKVGQLRFEGETLKRRFDRQRP